MNIVKQKDSFIKINSLDEQLAERKQLMKKELLQVKKGQKQSSSNAQALKEDNKRKEPYMNTSSISKLVKENKMITSKDEQLNYLFAFKEGKIKRGA